MPFRLHQLLLLATALCLIMLTPLSSALELPTLQAMLRLLRGESYKSKSSASMTLQELGASVGVCKYDFIDYVGHNDKQQCARDDQHILHLLPSETSGETSHKPPILVKCLQAQLSDNVTSVYSNTLLMMSSINEIVTLLKPVGNATKRHEPGSCVLMLFYTETSLGCAHVAPYANMLPKLFPTLRVAAVDALKFPSFNTDFGIVGLPTLLLFHQGRPVVKFYSDVGTFAAFVTRHTGIQPTKPVPTAAEIKGPLPLQPVPKPDYMLFLAWAFILFCLGRYFAESQLCKQIVEMIKRAWRESEAQLEPN